jgi:hypothetical protein
MRSHREPSEVACGDGLFESGESVAGWLSNRPVRDVRVLASDLSSIGRSEAKDSTIACCASQGQSKNTRGGRYYSRARMKLRLNEARITEVCGINTAVGEITPGPSARSNASKGCGLGWSMRGCREAVRFTRA